ncbi:MAG: hypothetical protein A2X36_08230 [Elusimicrobia bacterium GWA2_69_24]|nr:MAG: hypothetical protein A2X36_08230 [Elusimicrobia bacterium GWA2_69_24]HBL18163.1 hypothetical protein [Elusimicrobiota bacterium]
MKRSAAWISCLLLAAALPAAAQTPEPAKPLLPALQLMSGVTLKVNALGQFRYTAVDGERDSASSRNDTTSFRVQTARVKFTGDLPKDFRYTLQLAFERPTSTTTQNSALYDVMLTYAPRTWLNLSGGQFAVPVSAENGVPTDSMDLADRYYAAGRILNPATNHDIGVMAHGRLLGKRLSYYTGIFNGRGANTTDNNNNGHLYSARVEGAPLRWKTAGRDSEVLVGVGGMWERTHGDASLMRTADLTGTVFTEPYDRTVRSYDAALKVGPAALKAEYLCATLRGRRGHDPLVRAEGGYLQGSWRLLSGKIEPLLRYQTYDPDTRVRDSKDARWTTLGLNYFVNGQTSRLLANYTFKRERGNAYDNDEFVLQYQLNF